jgi:hypothetical protein
MKDERAKSKDELSSVARPLSFVRRRASRAFRRASRAFRRASWIGLLLFGCVLVMGLRPIRCADFWHHVASGRLVWERGWPAETEVFSHTAVSRPWVQFEWLAQLLIFLTYTHIGPAGVVLLKSAVIAGGYLLLWLACRRRGGDLSAAGVVLLAAIALIPRSYARPEAISWLFLGAFVLLLQLGRSRNPKLLYLLPILTVLWVNTHGMYVAALGLLGIGCAGETLKEARRRTTKEEPQSRDPAAATHPEHLEKRRDGTSPQAAPHSSLVALWLTLAACAIATVVNPYGIRIWSVPFRLLQSAEIARVIGEWGPSTASVLVDPYFLGLWVLSIIALVGLLRQASRQRLDVTDLLILCCFGLLAWRANRHIPLFAFVCAPIFTQHLSGFLAALPWSRRASLRWVPAAAGLSLLVVLTLLSLEPPRFDKLGLGVLHARYPEKMADFLVQNKIEGNLFNTYHFGNYLLWRLYPRNRVFIDGRVDMYGDDVLREYGTLCAGESGWEDLMARRQVAAAILEMPHGDQVADPLVSRMSESQDWKLVYWDDLTFVFLPKEPGVPIPMPKIELPAYRVRPDTFDARDASAERLQTAMAEFQRTLQRDPDCVLASAKLAECYQQIERYLDAIPLWKRVAAARPQDGQARYNLGLCLVRAGEYPDGEKSLREALRFGGPRVATLRTLGNARYEQQDYRGATGYFRRALRGALTDDRLRWSLVAAYEMMGEYGDALGELQILLKMNPSYPGAREKQRELMARQERGGDP